MRLLVAEDEPKIGIYLQQGLNEAGFNVDRFTNGKEALQHALSEAYDLLILDVMMPEIDGLEALQNIKEKHPEIRVIMITGNPSVENVQESIQGGASGFIVKPFNTAKVLDTLHKTLDNMSRETQ